MNKENEKVSQKDSFSLLCVYENLQLAKKSPGRLNPEDLFVITFFS